MTTIVATESNGDVQFASDSQISYGWRKSPDSVSKVFPNGSVVFGVAGAVRVANILRWSLLPEPPKSRAVEDLERWAVMELAPTLSKALNDALAMRVDSNEADTGSTFIMAVNGRAFLMSADFAVTREGDGRYAVGSGSAYARGALAAGATLVDAVKIAARFDVGTGGKVAEASWRGLVAGTK